jgi:hypothetical protein
MRSWCCAIAGSRPEGGATGNLRRGTTLETPIYSRSGLRARADLFLARALPTRAVIRSQGGRRVVDKTVQSLFGLPSSVRRDESTGRGKAMENSEDILRDSVPLEIAPVTIDDWELPAPVSSFEHVARSTASRESLVPPKPIWPFGLRAHPHRQAS